jgi:hypothetical protein
MAKHSQTSYLFRIGVDLHVRFHARPLRLSELRTIWRWVRRFVYEQSSSAR